MVLCVAYYTKGIYHLIDGNELGDAVDLRQRWVEQRYFLQGQNPFDIWLNNAPIAKRDGSVPLESFRNAQVDFQLGVVDPAHPPWGYISGMLFLWPKWPAVRWYYAMINLVFGLVIGGWAFQLGRAYGRSGAFLLSSAAVAFGGATTALEVGQYTIVVTGLLAASLWFDNRNFTTLSGLCLALAMVKPTIAGLFMLAFFTRKRLLTLTIAFLYMVVASGIVWLVVDTNPLEMLRQLLTVGAVTGGDGTIGPITFLLNTGIESKAATLVTVVLVGGPALLLMLSSFGQSPLVSFAIAAVAGRLWTYHRYYDDVMLVFLVVALGVLALQYRNSILLWMAFFAVGVTVWAPGRIVVLASFQLVQIVTWLGGLTILLAYSRSQRGKMTLQD
jgi:hypothetical protein